MKKPLVDRNCKVIISAGILIACGWVGLMKDDPAGGLRPAYSIPRYIEYSFTLRNKSDRLVREAEFWAYAPAKQTATQQCVNLETSHPHDLITDELGNQILHFTIHNLSPYATKTITVNADLLLSNKPNPVPVTDLTVYLKAEKYCEVDDPEILLFATKLRGPTPVKTAENILNWVAEHVHYTGDIGNPRGALFALQNRQGDRADFMYLFAALCRANSIPARGIGGYVIGGDGALSEDDYHNWVEFYVDGVWRIADPQQKVFMKNSSHYIAMQVIGRSSERQKDDNDQFRFVRNRLKVKVGGRC